LQSSRQRGQGCRFRVGRCLLVVWMQLIARAIVRGSPGPARRARRAFSASGAKAFRRRKAGPETPASLPQVARLATGVSGPPTTCHAPRRSAEARPRFERLDERAWPSASVVRRLFGSWREARGGERGHPYGHLAPVSRLFGSLGRSALLIDAQVCRIRGAVRRVATLRCGRVVLARCLRGSGRQLPRRSLARSVQSPRSPQTRGPHSERDLGLSRARYRAGGKDVLDEVGFHNLGRCKTAVTLAVHRCRS
jgi:hypothetical protein